MAYAIYTDVNLLTNLTSLDVANADVTNIIAEATKELNALINVSVVRERILWIDSTRRNMVDGSNTTYYIRNWENRFLADANDDGTVTTADITVYAVNRSVVPNVETVATVTSIDASLGKFVLSTAYPNNYNLYVTYEWCYRSPYTPDPLIKLACVLLSAAYCYAKINFGRAPQVAFGNTRIYRHIESFDLYYQRFMKVVNQINNKVADSMETEEPSV